MDVASLAVSIVALYSSCRQCYKLLCTIKSAEDDSQVHLRELEIQQSILKAWGFYWALLPHEDDEVQQTPSGDDRRQTKLTRFLSRNRYKAEGVINTLIMIVGTLSNQEKLISRYGIKLGPPPTNMQALHDSVFRHDISEGPNDKDLTTMLEAMSTRLSILNKCRWALKDKNSFRQLIVDLRSYGDALYRLCPEGVSESMNIFLTMDCLAMVESPDELIKTARIAAHEAQFDETSTVCAGYDLLASAAKWKARVNDVARGTRTGTFKAGHTFENDQLADAQPQKEAQGPSTQAPSAAQETKGSQKPSQTQASRDSEASVAIPGSNDIVENPDAENVDRSVSKRVTIIPEPQVRILGKNLALFEGEVVYIDMRDCRGPPVATPYGPYDNRREPPRYMHISERSFGETQYHNPLDSPPLPPALGMQPLGRPTDLRLRALVEGHVETFQEASAHEGLCGLDIVGMVEHQKGEKSGYCSILYRLPGTIGTCSRKRPADHLKLQNPISLESMIEEGYRSRLALNLGARFALARTLVRAVCCLHASGWLHKNLRAESIIFFPEEEQHDIYSKDVMLDTTNPILMGYLFSRLEHMTLPAAVLPAAAAGTIGHSKVHAPTQGAGCHSPEISPFAPSVGDTPPRSCSWLDGWRTTYHTKHNNTFAEQRSNLLPQRPPADISDFRLDYYQHAAKHANPSHAYRYAYDLYSLGVLLVEIGLWRFIQGPDEDQKETKYKSTLATGYSRREWGLADHYERRRWICRKYLQDLRLDCGEVYAKVVLDCLMADGNDDGIDGASHRELCAKIVADLEACKA